MSETETATKPLLWKDAAFMERPVDTDTTKKGVSWRYWNVSGMGIYMLASVTFLKRRHGNFEAFDWACYLGANPQGAQSERAGWEPVMRFGAKLSRKIAVVVFPEFADIPYRP